MSSHSDIEMAEIVEEGRELVTFSDIPDVIACDRDVSVRYTLGRDVIGKPHDWVGLFRSGWNTWQEHVRFVWAERVAKRNRRRAQPDRRVVFRKKQLLGLHYDGSYFQFVYMSRDNDILGVSCRFLLVDDLRVHNLLVEAVDTSESEEYLDGLAKLFTEVESKKRKRMSARQRRLKNRQFDHDTLQAPPEPKWSRDVSHLADPSDDTLTDNDVSQSVFDDHTDIATLVTRPPLVVTTVTYAYKPRVCSIVNEEATIVTSRAGIASTIATITSSMDTAMSKPSECTYEKSFADALKNVENDATSVQLKPSPEIAKLQTNKSKRKAKHNKKSTENKPCSENNKLCSVVKGSTVDTAAAHSISSDNKITTCNKLIDTSDTTRERLASGSNSEPLFEDIKRRHVLNVEDLVPFPPDNESAKQTEITSEHTMQVNMMAMSLELQDLITAKEKASALEKENGDLKSALDNEKNKLSEYEQKNTRELVESRGLMDEIMYTLNSHGYTAVVDKNETKTELSKVLQSLVEGGAWQSAARKRSEKNMASLHRQEKTIESLRTEVTCHTNQCELLKATSKKLNTDIDKRDHDLIQYAMKLEQLRNEFERKDHDVDILTKDLVASRTSVKSLTEIFATTEKDLKEQIRTLQVKLATRSLTAKKQRIMNVGETAECSGVTSTDSCPKTSPNKKRKTKTDPSGPPNDITITVAKVPSQKSVKDDPAVNDLSDFSQDNIHATSFQVIDESDGTAKLRKRIPTAAIFGQRYEALSATTEPQTTNAGFHAQNASLPSTKTTTQPPHRANLCPAHSFKTPNSFSRVPANQAMQAFRTPTSVENAMFTHSRPCPNDSQDRFTILCKNHTIPMNTANQNTVRNNNAASTSKAEEKHFRVTQSLESLRRQAESADINGSKIVYYNAESQVATTDGPKHVHVSLITAPESIETGLAVPVFAPNNVRSLALPENRIRCLQPALGMSGVWHKMANLYSETCRFCGIILNGEDRPNDMDDYSGYNQLYRK